MNSSRQRPGLLFTLVGPAGAGKNRLMKYVMGLTSVRQLPTATTRPMRPGEQQGREHHFVSKDEFQRMIDANELLEHQEIHGNLYGMPRAAIEAALDSGQSVIADIEVLGAAHARAMYPENVVSIFIQTPSIGTLIERMRERRETETEISKRLLRVPMELAYACECNYVILNDSFERAADKLYQIVSAELRGAHPIIEPDKRVEYRCTYTARILPIFHDEVLRRSTAPEVPTTLFTGGEMPQQAALRCLRDELHIETHDTAVVAGGKADGEFLPPITLDYSRDSDGEHLSYLYLYCLDTRIDAPAGWSWTAVETLPEALRAAVLECEA